MGYPYSVFCRCGIGNEISQQNSCMKFEKLTIKAVLTSKQASNYQRNVMDNMLKFATILTHYVFVHLKPIKDL